MRQHNYEVWRTQYRKDGKAPIVEIVGRHLSHAAAQAVAQHEALAVTKRIAALCAALKLPIVVKQRQMLNCENTVMRVVHGDVHDPDKRRPDRGVIFYEFVIVNAQGEL